MPLSLISRNLNHQGTKHINEQGTNSILEQIKRKNVVWKKYGRSGEQIKIFKK